MSRKYFGTDWIRGEANKDLSVDIVMKLGFALGKYLKKNNKTEKKPRVILGTDTRISGYMIRSALSAGLTALGVNVDFVGVIPTPGVAYITRKTKAQAGIMISASHNPAKDNGIKIFGPTGYKLPDEVELEIESLMDSFEEIKKEVVPGDKLGKVNTREDDYLEYVSYLASTVKSDLSDMKIILDVANGAAYRAATKVFRKLGADIMVINNIPNGKNINVNCGSTHIENLQKIVPLYNADLGLAFDGDADRLLAVDKHGNVIDGDKIIALLSVHMKEKNDLNGDKVVTTVMSNMGFEKYLDDKGISLIRANVGDRYVLEKMKNQGVNIGGEQSGHIILLDYNTTGDGILSGIQLAAAVQESGKGIDELVSEIVDWPQKLVNVRVDNAKKNKWSEYSKINDIIAKKEKELAGYGRILVRTSGTEPLVRVMVEAKEAEMVETIVHEVAEVIKTELA